MIVGVLVTANTPNKILFSKMCLTLKSKLDFNK